MNGNCGGALLDQGSEVAIGVGGSLVLISIVSTIDIDRDPGSRGCVVICDLPGDLGESGEIVLKPDPPNSGPADRSCI